MTWGQGELWVLKFIKGHSLIERKNYPKPDHLFSPQPVCNCMGGIYRLHLSSYWQNAYWVMVKYCLHHQIMLTLKWPKLVTERSCLKPTIFHKLLLLFYFVDTWTYESNSFLAESRECMFWLLTFQNWEWLLLFSILSS